jgi:hypothetical protein
MVIKEKLTKQTLIEMLRYRRSEGSKTQKLFCNRFLRPVFGSPDSFGNYMIQVGDNPRICFTAHHDTCHVKEGFQALHQDDGYVSLDMMVADKDKSSCLGADDTVGIWLILNMIENKIPGTYCIFAGEEVGGIGSLGMVNSKPSWLSYTDLMISLDRAGYTDVITYQAGRRCCSDALATALATELNVTDITGELMFGPDATGVFTDSANFVGSIGNCTNLSVGYDWQHTEDEFLDVEFSDLLLHALLTACWDRVADAARENPVEDDCIGYTRYGKYNYLREKYGLWEEVTTNEQ